MKLPLRAHPVAGPRRLVWIASYPRSGSTWTRLLLANFLAASERPVAINDLQTALPSLGTSARAWFDATTGLSSSECSDDEVAALRPAAIRAHAARSPGKRMFGKVHYALETTVAGEPSIPEDVTTGAIYLVRNPLDVAVSYAHHFYRDLASAVAELNDPGNSHSERGGRQLRQSLLDWSGHATSWLAAEFPVLVVRYEDLLADAVRQLARMARFLKLTGAGDELRLRRAVAAAAFERLQGDEAQHGFRERYPGRRAFFRSGRPGDWRQQLTAAQARALAGRHERVMLACGYDPQEAARR